MTINGCVRVMSSPAYHKIKRECRGSGRRLRKADSVSLLDETLFRMSAITGHQNVTDAYLLGLDVRNHGRLATFDRSIPLNAVLGARPGNLALIRSS